MDDGSGWMRDVGCDLRVGGGPERGCETTWIRVRSSSSAIAKGTRSGLAIESSSLLREWEWEPGAYREWFRCTRGHRIAFHGEPDATERAV